VVSTLSAQGKSELVWDSPMGDASGGVVLGVGAVVPLTNGDRGATGFVRARDVNREKKVPLTEYRVGGGPVGHGKNAT